MRREWNRFEIKGHTFVAYIPTNSDDNSWRLTVHKGDEIVRDELIPMFYEPRFGPDVMDTARLNEKVEELIKELNLESEGDETDKTEKNG